MCLCNEAFVFSTANHTTFVNILDYNFVLDGEITFVSSSGKSIEVTISLSLENDETPRFGN